MAPATVCIPGMFSYAALGGLVAGWLGWGDWAVVVLAAVFVLMSVHHFMEK